ncbi:MAG: hypothetical protein Q4E35_04160 [Eubacteriales bacterium]|nr:hypothetical protein [Eubacteriales bacterium]
MGAMFFQNGIALGADAGWGGYTGNNNYVVRYDFTTGAQGASRVAIWLDMIWNRRGDGNQTFGFKLSTGEYDFCNARGVTPDSNTALLEYSPQTGYGCVLYATDLNLTPNTRYYLFVYVISSGTEYYTGWNCVDPAFAVEGSYTPPVSTVSSISPSVSTGGNVTIVMNRAGNVYHKAVFSYQSSTLAISAPFADTLTYNCPRAWLNRNTAAKSITVDVTVTSYSDAACTAFAGSVSAQFTLSADRDMHPVFYAEALNVTAVNSGSAISGFVSGVSRARVSFLTGLISLTDCAGAGIEKYSVSMAGKTYDSETPDILTDVINIDTALVCTVTDTRGMSHSVSVTLTVSPYVAPSLTELGALRCSADGSENESGAYFKVKFRASCSQTGGNTCTVTVAAKPSGGSYGNETVLSGYENGVWSDRWSTPAIIGGTLTGDSVTVRFTVTDAVGASSVYTVPMYRLQWAMKFNSSGTAVGFGMAPDAQNALQIPDHWRLYGGIPVLSPSAYGTAAPETAVSSPVEGQIYLRISS